MNAVPNPKHSGQALSLTRLRHLQQVPCALALLFNLRRFKWLTLDRILIYLAPSKWTRRMLNSISNHIEKAAHHRPLSLQPMNTQTVNWTSAALLLIITHQLRHPSQLVTLSSRGDLKILLFFQPLVNKILLSLPKQLGAKLMGQRNYLFTKTQTTVLTLLLLPRRHSRGRQWRSWSALTKIKNITPRYVKIISVLIVHNFV